MKRAGLGSVLGFWWVLMSLAQPAQATPTQIQDNAGNGHSYDMNTMLIKTSATTGIVFYRTGTSHASDTGRIASNTYTCSSDPCTSVTWAAQTIVYTDPNTAYDARDANGGIICDTTGTCRIYVFFARRTSSGAGAFIDFGYIRSTDLSGTSWSSFTSLITAAGEVSSLLGRGGMVKSGTRGTYLVPWFGHNSADTIYETHFVKTTDYGLTWADTRVYSGPLQTGEPSLLWAGEDKYIYFSRNESGGVLWYMASSDNGVSWTQPAATNVGGTAINVPYSFNDETYDQFYLLFMNRQSSGSIQYVTSSVSQAFLSPVSFGSATNIDTGYTANGYNSAVRLSENAVLTTWSKENSASDADIMYEILTLGSSTVPGLTIE